MTPLVTHCPLSAPGRVASSLVGAVLTAHLQRAGTTQYLPSVWTLSQGINLEQGTDLCLQLANGKNRVGLLVGLLGP